MFRQKLAGLLGALVLVGPGHAIELHVDDAWIRTAPPKAPARVGYLHIHNPSSELATLVGVTSPQFGKIEMHRSRFKDGMMHMERVDKIDVPAGADVRFEPNGYHLMMTGNRLPLATGAQVTLELQWSDGSSQSIIAGVRPNKDKQSGEHTHGTTPHNHDH